MQTNLENQGSLRFCDEERLNPFIRYPVLTDRAFCSGSAATICDLGLDLVSFQPPKTLHRPTMRHFRLFLLLSALLINGFAFSQNVGIGISTPLQKLHVNGNLRFDGALMPNGNAGSTGQVLISQGAGVAPIWGPVGGLITTYKNTATRTTINSTAFIPITGLSRTITLTSNAAVIISTYGSMETFSTSFGGSGAIVQVFNNGVAIPDMFQTVDVMDGPGFTGNISPWSMMNSVTLTPGSYTFTVRARKYAFDNFYAGGNTTAPNPNEGALILMVFPQ